MRYITFTAFQPHLIIHPELSNSTLGGKTHLKGRGGSISNSPASEKPPIHFSHTRPALSVAEDTVTPMLISSKLERSCAKSPQVQLMSEFWE